MESQTQIELSRVFNTIGIRDILSIENITDIRRIKQNFKAVEDVSDDTILSECKRIQKNHIKVQLF
jgi:hypothetical protein